MCIRDRNLGINLALLSEPMPPVLQRSCAHDRVLGAPVRAVPDPFHCWQRTTIKVAGLQTLGHLKKYIEDQHGFDVTAIYGAAGRIVYSDVGGDGALATPIRHLEVCQAAHQNPTSIAQFIVDLEDDEGAIVLMPMLVVPWG